MKQTATEWLFQKLWDQPKDKLTWYGILEQAKTMEKEQMEDVWHDSRIEDFGDDYIGKQTSFNDYYNQTFNNKEK